MSLIDLSGKRILVTEAGSFMGPALCGVLGEFGAEVFADQRPSYDRESVLAMAEEAGTIDALVINFAIPAPTTRAVEVSEDEWRSSFARMVDPLPRLCAAFLPEMTERGSGKIVLMGSASALRGMKRTTTYSAARGAQLAYVQALGVEMAPHNVQVNAIAQNFVDNPTYFPSAVQANPAFQARLSREVPLGRLVSAREDALFAAYLCSAAANCFVGQVFPLCGGWVLR